MQNWIQSHYHVVFHRDWSQDQYLSLSISCLWVIYVENTMLSTMGMLMISQSTWASYQLKPVTKNNALWIREVYWWHLNMDEDQLVKVKWQQNRVHDAGHKEKSGKDRGMNPLHKDHEWGDKQCHVSQRSGVPSGLWVKIRHACKQVDQCSVYYNQKDSKHLIPVDGETMKIMMQALVLSRLDYCNSLLIGMTDIT